MSLFVMFLLDLFEVLPWRSSSVSHYRFQSQNSKDLVDFAVRKNYWNIDRPCQIKILLETLLLIFVYFLLPQDLPCIEVDEDTQIDCDEKCKEIKAKKNLSIQQEEKEKRDAELRLQQEELERFERKKQGRKRKPKQEDVEEKAEDGFFKLYGKWIGISILLIVFIAFCVQISIAAWISVSATTFVAIFHLLYYLWIQGFWIILNKNEIHVRLFSVIELCLFFDIIFFSYRFRF